MVSYDFEQKMVLVTGGTKGIGKAIVMALLKGKAKVIVTYKSDEEAADLFLNALNDTWKRQVNLLRSDVANRDHVRALFENESIDMVVNNAGILKQGNFQDLSDEQWDRTLEVNLKGPFMVGQEFLLHGPEGGAMVNISSVGGQTGGNKAPDYAASKAALISLTRSLARLGTTKNIRVNAVAPGWIKTDIFNDEQLVKLESQAAEIIPMGRLGTPDEIAGSVLFLLSGQASYITGHCLNVNGGLYFG